MAGLVNEIKRFYWCELRIPGPMTLEVSIPYSVLYQDKFYPFFVRIDNKSNMVITAITVKLKKVIFFTFAISTSMIWYSYELLNKRQILLIIIKFVDLLIYLLYKIKT